MPRMTSSVERNRSIGNSTRQISKIECRLDEGNKDCGVFEVPRMGFVATGSREAAASAVMFAAVTAGVPSAAVGVRSAETLPASVEALRRMPAASHVEAA